MWLTSNRPAAWRVARCSSTTEVYQTGMSHPAKGTILAPMALCVSCSGVTLGSVLPAQSIGMTAVQSLPGRGAHADVPGLVRADSSAARDSGLLRWMADTVNGPGMRARRVIRAAIQIEGGVAIGKVAQPGRRQCRADAVGTESRKELASTQVSDAAQRAFRRGELCGLRSARLEGREIAGERVVQAWRARRPPISSTPPGIRSSM